MPATNSWLRSRFFSSPLCLAMRARHTSSVSAGSSASGPCSSQPATGRVDAVGHQVDLAHARRVAVAHLDRRSRAGSHVGAAPATSAGRMRALAQSTGPNVEHRRDLRPRLCARRGKAQPAGEHRVDDDPVALELEDQELAAPRNARVEHWPLNAASSAGVPRRTSDWGVVAPVSGRPARPASSASARIARSGSSGTARSREVDQPARTLGAW